jgi:alpha-N-arabinofuranosidase
MLLAEELGAEPIYVVNNGFSHRETTSPPLLQPFLDEALGALEFLTGQASRGWGAVRASMGREQPWEINYLGIGNEVCRANLCVHYHQRANIL